MLGGLFSLPGNIDWWWHIGFPGVGSLVTAIVAYWQAEPFLFGLLSVIAIYVGLFVVGIPLRRKWQHTNLDSASGGSGTTINIRRVEGSVNVQQPPTPAAKPEPESPPSRYRRDKTIRLTDFWRENAEMESGKKVIRHWMFQNCGILGPAVLFVQEPNKPTNFLECEWEAGKQAFSVKHPKEYSGDVEIISLFHTKFVGCRFTQVEMAVSQETYERYKEGEHLL